MDVINLRLLRWDHPRLPAYVHAKSLQSRPTLCSCTDCSPWAPLHGLLQARVLEWAAISSSRGSSQPRSRTCISHIFCTGGRFFTTSATTWVNPKSNDKYCYKEKAEEGLPFGEDGVKMEPETGITRQGNPRISGSLRNREERRGMDSPWSFQREAALPVP